jgi:HNH endonuclease
MSTLPIRLRRRVVLRAGGRCEYCELAQEGQEATFHIDHIVPVAAGGPTVLENLALACVSCSLRKADHRSGRDPETGRSIPLFHPRRQRWDDHFRWQGVRVVGLTPTGRATIATLQLNRPPILAIRAEEMVRGRHPPPR